MSQFEEFKEKFNSSSLSAVALAEQMQNVDERIITYAKTCKNGELSTEGFKASVEGMTLSAKAATVATKGLSIAGNMLAMWAISEGIQLAVNLVDQLIVTTDELKESADDAIKELNSLQSETDSLNNELQTTNDRIAELESKDSLSFIEQEELKKLQDTSTELERQIELNKTLIAVQAGKTRDSALDYLNAKSSYEQYGAWDMSQVENGNSHYGSQNVGEIFKGTQLEVAEQQLNEYEDLLAKKEDVENRIADFQLANPDKSKYTLAQKDTLANLQMELSSYDTTLKSLGDSLYETIPDLDSYKDVLNPKYDQTYIDFINTIVDKYNKLFGNPTETITSRFNEIWNSSDFKKSKNTLEKLALAGQLDANVLNSNKTYKQLLDATGATAEQVAEHINSLIDAENQLSGMIDTINPLASANPPDYLNEYSEQISKLGDAYKSFKI